MMLLASPERTVTVESPALHHQAEFLAAARRSRTLHGSLATPPSTPAQFKTYVRRCLSPNRRGHLVCTASGELAGVININDIVRGAFPSGTLGYYAFAPHAGRGLMRAGLAAVLGLAFREHGLQRVEAYIQPGNARSLALAASLGFRREGHALRALKLRGRWRRHERWALTLEAWQATGARA